MKRRFVCQPDSDKILKFTIIKQELMILEQNELVSGLKTLTAGSR